MILRTLINEAGKMIADAGIEECRFEAELLMAVTLGVSRFDILINQDMEISEEQKKFFFELVKRRVNREPSAYIMGYKEFMGLNFKVRPGILIPRPDTEILVETIIDTVKKAGFKTSAEIGIGSGCISISLAKYTELECYGTDISSVAVKTARENAELNGAADRTNFYEGDIFVGLPNMKFDIVVSNPPYIKKKDMESLMPDVRDYEPHTALCGGDDGLDFYRKITEDAVGKINRGGYIFYEIGYDEAEDVSDILRQNGFEDINVIKDLGGLDRVVSARKGDFDV